LIAARWRVVLGLISRQVAQTYEELVENARYDVFEQFVFFKLMVLLYLKKKKIFLKEFNKNENV
jgi:hypothetical protein